MSLNFVIEERAVLV